MAIGDNPFREKQKQDRRRHRRRYTTTVYTLANHEELVQLAMIFTQIANQPAKYVFTTFEKGSTPEGVPFVFTRLSDDPEIEDKVFDKSFAHKVMARRFTQANFDEMDMLLNSQGDTVALGEIRFTYKTGEIGSILFWAELGPEARQTGGLDVLKKLLRSDEW